MNLSKNVTGRKWVDFRRRCLTTIDIFTSKFCYRIVPSSHSQPTSSSSTGEEDEEARLGT